MLPLGRSYPVLPLHNINAKSRGTCGQEKCNAGKHPYAPLAPHGLKDATTDTDTVAPLIGHLWA